MIDYTVSLFFCARVLLEFAFQNPYLWRVYFFDMPFKVITATKILIWATFRVIALVL